GRMTGELAFPVRVPIMRGGAVVYILTVAVRPHALQDLLTRTFPPEGEWTRAFNDPQGMIVARTREPERFVGQAGSPEFMRRRTAIDEGFFRDRTVDASEVYVAFSRAPFSHWTAGVAIPVTAIDAPLRRSLTVTIGTGLFLMALAGGIAYVIGRRIARPIRAATEAAQALTRGGAIDVPASR